MKVIGILGSPRRGGNSEILLDRALEAGQSQGLQIKKLILNEMNLKPCRECLSCARDGKCAVNDDMQLIYRQLDQADRLIIASPIFFGSLSAQLKAMVDRYQCRWQARYTLGAEPAKGKKGFLILVSATNREKFFQNAESIVKNLFAVLGIEFSGRVYCPDCDQKARVLKHKDCLKQAFALGKTIAKNTLLLMLGYVNLLGLWIS